MPDKTNADVAEQLEAREATADQLEAGEALAEEPGRKRRRTRQNSSTKRKR